MNTEYNFNETDLAYLAGIIDGEGCINVAATPRNGRTNWRLILDITNTNENLMQWLEDTFGEIVSTSYKRRHDRTNIFGWTASGRQAQLILKLALPYLKVKNLQAELALEMNIARYGGSSRWTYTPEEEANRKEIYVVMRELNSKDGRKGAYIREQSYAQKEVNAPSQRPCETVG